MRVLAIMGSPRRGDSYRLTQGIEEAMRGMGEVEFEYLWLRDANLAMCRGCYNCLLRGEEHCPLDDDRAEIERRMLAADGVLFASPVYAMSMTALLKNLLDRLSYTMHRPRFFAQKAFIVVTAGAAGAKETAQTIAAVHFMGFEMVGRLATIVLPEPRTAAEQRQTRSQVQRAARRFHRALTRTGPRTLTLTELILFRIHQVAYTYLKDTLVADHEHFQERGWFDRSRRWYAEARVSPVKDLLARLVGWMVARQTRARLAAQAREHAGNR